MLLDHAPWISVWVEQVRLPNGVIIDDYFNVALRSWVAVFAVAEDGRIPLVRQYRYGIDSDTLELPAGYLEDGETPEDSAQRELREEVGCDAAAFRYLGSYAVMPTRGDMAMHLVIAEGAHVMGAQALDTTESIEVCWYTPAELRDMWRSGAIAEAAHSAAIARGLDFLGSL